MKKATRAILGILVICAVVFYFGMKVWIQSDVNQICNEAQSKFEGNKVEALINTIESDTIALPTKNQAIWALGQLGAPNALSSLKSLQTGKPCDHEQNVCQRELQKAIDAIEGKRKNILFIH